MGASAPLPMPAGAHDWIVALQEILGMVGD